jgi:stearoyl-CoA desaturase (delta-9 desaturase)
MSSPFLHRLQRRHFLLFDVAPGLATIAAFCLVQVIPPTATDMYLFAGMWALTGFSLSIGFHRLFTHRAFKTSLPVRVLLTVFGCMAARSSMITWTAMHRRHHQLADRPGDVHSPNLHGRTFSGRFRGWLYSHFTWLLKHEYPNVVYYVPDLLADTVTVKVDRMYHRWILLGLVIPAVIGGVVTQTWIGALTGILWGGFVRMFVVAQQVSALNSLTHMFGFRPFKTTDDHSHNNPLFGLLTWGEGWHNNHHAFPESARFACRWYEIDPGYGVIRVMEYLGLVWEVKRPSTERIRRLRSLAAAPPSPESQEPSDS